MTRLRQIVHFLVETEAPSCADPRNAAWARESAVDLAALIDGCELLLAQYAALDNFTLGGALTNAPFIKIREALGK